MDSNFTNFHAGCHGPAPLRGLFCGRTSQAQSDDRRLHQLNVFD